ncbi:hypothetical protein [Flavobacterium sp. LB1P62]|uniref:hypothetical protein n=1 Tax=unclassified Flavobacterium TaxID=196869 RepID=UPI003AAE00E6
MEQSENEVYLGSNSYCKVGKITPKKSFEEDKSITETDFDKFDENVSCVML